MIVSDDNGRVRLRRWSCLNEEERKLWNWRRRQKYKERVSNGICPRCNNKACKESVFCEKHDEELIGIRLMDQCQCGHKSNVVRTGYQKCSKCRKKEGFYQYSKTNRVQKGEGYW